MKTNEQRLSFDAWHLKQFKDINSDLNEDEAKNLYDRVYAHEKQDLIRQMEFNAWLASSNREGYKLVPLNPTPKMIDSTWDHDDEIIEMSSNTRNEFIYKAMIGRLMNNDEEECIVCWSCDEVIALRDRSENDGFCPLCNQEIELDDH